MPVIILAHRDPQLRASLGSALTARGFEVIGVDSVDSALDAAAAGSSALLVELTLLAEEDLEVKTRLDLRSGRPTRILALTHKASAEEMSMLKRHGAGLLSRPVEDIERMATMLRISEEAPAPWDGPAAAPAPVSSPEPKAKGGRKSKAAPPPAPSPEPEPAPESSSSAPWDAAPPTPPEPAAAATPPPPSVPVPPPVAPPASPSGFTFKPPPANFMPPDLSKSFPAAPPMKESVPETPVPPPELAPPPESVSPPPPSFAPPPESVSPPPPSFAPPESVSPPPPSFAPPPESVSSPPPTFDPPPEMLSPPPSPAGLRPAAAPDGAPADDSALDDAPTTIAHESELPGMFSPPESVAAPPPPARAAPSFELSAPEADGPAPADDSVRAPSMSTNVFLDEPEESTNKVGVPGAESADVSGSTSVQAPKPPPKVEVEAEEGSTGTFAIPPRTPDVIAPKAPTAPRPPPEERTQVIPELAEQAIPAPPSADPFATAPDTSAGAPDLANISARVSPEWFADAESPEKKPPANGPSVLVVDDEPAFRTFLKDALGSQGYVVHTAINGPNALRFVKATPGIDLVISDLHMPHMDGFELKHEIDIVIGRAMPFIVCTADASEDKIHVAAQVGAAALVPKPIENLDAFFAIVIDTLKDAGVIARRA